MKDVSIIIVNYNTSVLIKNLLQTIEEKTEGISYEVIVVDNNPTEQFYLDLKDYLEKIIYLPLKENVGFGRANNEGLKVAKGRNIFFLNPDTLLINNAIKILSDYLDSYEQVGVCGGNLYEASLQPMHSFVRVLPSFLWDFNSLMLGIPFRILYGRNFQHNYTEKPIEVGYITGADMMVKRSVLNEVGGFDPDFFMYYEESELSFRIKQTGKKIISLPYAKIIHLEGQSFEIKENRIKQIAASQMIYDCKTNKSRFGFYFTYFIRVLSYRCKILTYSILRNQNMKNYWMLWLKGYKK